MYCFLVADSQMLHAGTSYKLLNTPSSQEHLMSYSVIKDRQESREEKVEKTNINRGGDNCKVFWSETWSRFFWAFTHNHVTTRCCWSISNWEYMSLTVTGLQSLQKEGRKEGRKEGGQKKRKQEVIFFHLRWKMQTLFFFIISAPIYMCFCLCYSVVEKVLRSFT